MALENFGQLNPMHISALQEIGNIGSGNAATALATLLNTVVDIAIPNIRLVEFADISEYLGGSDLTALGMTVQLEGDINGMMLHVVQKEFAGNLINHFYEKVVDDLNELSEMDISVVREMSNITCAAYVNSLAGLTGMFINISPPTDYVDQISNILRVPVAAFHELGNQAIFIDQIMTIANTEVHSHMILVLEMNSLNTLLNKLGIPT